MSSMPSRRPTLWKSPRRSPESTSANVSSRGGIKRILVVGHSGAGKDTACEYLARAAHLRFAGTTSRYLARYVAARLGVSVEQAYRSRHANRNLWHRVVSAGAARGPHRLARQRPCPSGLDGEVRRAGLRRGRDQPRQPGGVPRTPSVSGPLHRPAHEAVKWQPVSMDNYPRGGIEDSSDPANLLLTPGRRGNLVDRGNLQRRRAPR